MTESQSPRVPVVLHFRGGRTEHVYAPPQIDADRQTVSVTDQESSSREVAFADLKAIFFLSDASTAASGLPTGVTLAVQFADGELIRGIATRYDPGASGFFLYPHDRSKNDRVFVISAAVVSIDVEKL
ncbi:MAG TPA: hypothetical protein VM557_13615 [Thermoanaerobaculia bacterium]|nr:hypothetical protein [Thermoanaerobaculia bacterium]